MKLGLLHLVSLAKYAPRTETGSKYVNQESSFTRCDDDSDVAVIVAKKMGRYDNDDDTVRNVMR